MKLKKQTIFSQQLVIRKKKKGCMPKISFYFLYFLNIIYEKLKFT